MNFTVVNKGLSVGDIRIVSVSASSVVLIGDAETIACSSASDTAENRSLVGPHLPLPAEGRS